MSVAAGPPTLFIPEQEELDALYESVLQGFSPSPVSLASAYSPGGYLETVFHTPATPRSPGDDTNTPGPSTQPTPVINTNTSPPNPSCTYLKNGHMTAN